MHSVCISKGSNSVDGHWPGSVPKRRAASRRIDARVVALYQRLAAMTADGRIIKSAIDYQLASLKRPPKRSASTSGPSYRSDLTVGQHTAMTGCRFPLQ
jgi:hypothetical protein